MSFVELSNVLGNLGEFLGSIAVVATLIYVARQMKATMLGIEANTIAIKGASEISGNDSVIRQGVSFYSDETLTELVIRGMSGEVDLSLNEYIRFGHYLDVGFQTHQVTYLQWKKELLDDEYWSFCIRWFGKRVLSQPGAQKWWNSNKSLFTPNYRNLIDRLIEEQGWERASEFLD